MHGAPTKLDSLLTDRHCGSLSRDRPCRIGHHPDASPMCTCISNTVALQLSRHTKLIRGLIRVPEDQYSVSVGICQSRWVGATRENERDRELETEGPRKVVKTLSSLLWRQHHRTCTAVLTVPGYPMALATPRSSLHWMFG